MARTDIVLLKRIFHEATVIDIDFSKWDRFVRLVVMAAALPPLPDGRSQVLQIDFCRFRSFSWTSSDDVPLLDNPDEHCQMTFIESRIESSKSVLRVRLSGLSPTPHLEIECESIVVSSIDPDAIFRFNPAWDKPAPPLLRPSLEELSSKV